MLAQHYLFPISVSLSSNVILNTVSTRPLKKIPVKQIITLWFSFIAIVFGTTCSLQFTLYNVNLSFMSKNFCSSLQKPIKSNISEMATTLSILPQKFLAAGSFLGSGSLLSFSKAITLNFSCKATLDFSCCSLSRWMFKTYLSMSCLWKNVWTDWHFFAFPSNFNAYIVEKNCDQSWSEERLLVQSFAIFFVRSIFLSFHSQLEETIRLKKTFDFC